MALDKRFQRDPGGDYNQREIESRAIVRDKRTKEMIFFSFPSSCSCEHFIFFFPFYIEKKGLLERGCFISRSEEYNGGNFL